MDPLISRFLTAGAVIVCMGVAMATTGAGVGEGAIWKGAVVAAMGVGLVVTGVVRYWKPPT